MVTLEFTRDSSPTGGTLPRVCLKPASGEPGPTLWTWPAANGGYYRELSFALNLDGDPAAWGLRLAEILATLGWAEYVLDAGPLRTSLGQAWPEFLDGFGRAFLGSVARPARIQLGPERLDPALSAAADLWCEKLSELRIVRAESVTPPGPARPASLTGTLVRMLSLTQKPV